MAMAHDTVAAIRQFQVLPHGDKGVGFGDQHLGQHAAGPFTCKFAQRIVDRLRLTESDDSGISRHGVSLLSGGSGRLGTRLDTPPSINRRHPDSRIAPYEARGGDWIVTSGYRGDRIFYRRAMLACHSTKWRQIEFEYPASEKRLFDSFVTRTSYALRAYKELGC